MKHRLKSYGTSHRVYSGKDGLTGGIGPWMPHHFCRVLLLLPYLSMALLSPVTATPLTLMTPPTTLNASSSVNQPESVDPLAGPLQLASSKPLPSEAELPRYLVSEKLDGVRARWTGKTLITRSGNLIPAPDWFIENLPVDLLLDGELWAGRGSFEWLSGLVRSHGREDEWHRVHFMVFDTPKVGLGFAQRYAWLQGRLSGLGPPVVLVEQKRFQRLDALDVHFNTLTEQGAEGLMLHREDAVYIDGRNPLLIKLKPLSDAEGQVIGYRPGKGQFEGMMGSLRLRLADGREFLLGTGFSLDNRRHPPAIGDWVTFQYHGLTEKGLPKGARFLRVRPKE
ncbi:DNA ligase [Shewanella litorisediminis]|nr:DNA ligase [Shewanella litorisediminis]MCL2918747.1 DNA ligase [Shewanella litorisediminis]